MGILAEIVEKLWIKGFEQIYRREKESQNAERKSLQNRISLLESEINEKKVDIEQDKNYNQNKILEMSQQLVSMSSQIKIYEEKIKLFEADKLKL